MEVNEIKVQYGDDWEDIMALLNEGNTLEEAEYLLSRRQEAEEDAAEVIMQELF